MSPDSVGEDRQVALDVLRGWPSVIGVALGAESEPRLPTGPGAVLQQVEHGARMVDDQMRQGLALFSVQAVAIDEGAEPSSVVRGERDEAVSGVGEISEAGPGPEPSQSMNTQRSPSRTRFWGARS